MDVRRIAGALGFIALAAMAQPAAAATLHAIIVGDTSDAKIGLGVEADTNRFTREVTRIAEATGLHLNELVVTGPKFTRPNLIGILKGIRVGPDDVILFLYSGHGGGERGKDTKWPYLAVPDPATGKYTPLDFADVVDRLGESRPRLLLALVDACNNFGPDAKGARNDREQGVPIRQFSPELKAGYQRLFLNAKGTFVAAAASPSEVANGEVSGGVLTNGFLRALASEVGQPSPSWKSLASAATTPLSRTSPSGRTERQTPFFRLDMAEGATKPAAAPSTGGSSVLARPDSAASRGASPDSQRPGAAGLFK